MVQPDLEDLLEHLQSTHFVCEKCDAPFQTKKEAEEHEEKCKLHGSSEINVPSQKPVIKNHYRQKEVINLNPHNQLFILGIVMLVLLSFLPVSSPEEECLDILDDQNNLEKCLEDAKMQIRMISLLITSSYIFIFVGLYNTIRNNYR